MSLYDDIELPPSPTRSEKVEEEELKPQPEPEVKKNEEKTPPPPTSNLSFLKAQLESKKAQIQFKLKPPSVAPSSFSVKIQQEAIGPPPLKKLNVQSLLKPRRVQPLKIDPSTTFSIIPKSLKEDNVFLFNEIMVEDEYNPTAPTEYYSFKSKREAQLARERAAREVAERLEREHAEEVAKRGKGAAIAPPMELMEPSVIEPELPTPVETIPKKDVVSNIMFRMGFQQGLGLGKNQQGISTALQIKRIGNKTGMIVEESRERE